MPSRKHHDVRGNPSGPLSDAESLGILDSNTRCPRMQGNHRKADPNALSKSEQEELPSPRSLPLIDVSLIYWLTIKGG
jgi:hypothetical protein